MSADSEEFYEPIDPTNIDFSNAPYGQKKPIKIQARVAGTAQRVETILADGHHESTKDAAADDYIVTNPGGEEYPMSAAKFAQRYADSDEIGKFVPKWDPKQFIIIDRNVVFEAPWGGDMKMRAGSAIVFGGPNDIYGIAAQEFIDTYKSVNDMSPAELAAFNLKDDQIAPFITKANDSGSTVSGTIFKPVTLG